MIGAAALVVDHAQLQGLLGSHVDGSGPAAGMDYRTEYLGPWVGLEIVQPIQVGRVGVEPLSLTTLAVVGVGTGDRGAVVDNLKCNGENVKAN